MPEQNTNEQTSSLIEQLANKRVQIDTRDVFKNFEKNQKGVNNSMNGLGTEETKLKGDLRRDI